MRHILRDLDRLLRGRFSEQGQDPSSIPIAHLVQGGLALGVTYGLFMGLYAGLRAEDPTFLQVAVSAVKVPLLFLLTLVVTFPSLYVFSALGDSPLRGADTLRLLLAAIAVNLTLLASFGPITGFFTLSTDSYHFMVVLNTLFFAISGFVGLGFLGRTLARLFEAAGAAQIREEEARIAADDPPRPASAEGEDAGEEEGADAGERVVRRMELQAVQARVSERVKSSGNVFRVWIVIYAVVGAQMAWILRPFVGSPDLPFQLFRPRSSNFFEGFWRNFEALFR